MSEFVRALYGSCVRRANGVDARGNDKGAMNRQLLVHMDDIRSAGDLQQLQRLAHVSLLGTVKSSIDKLIERKLAPKSAAVDIASLSAAWDFLRVQTAGLSNQKLMPLLAKEAEVQPAVRPFYRFVCRMWLMSPPESVVESMGSVADDVFGRHRQLDHRNADMELQIRWNGPSAFNADCIIRAVQARRAFRFRRACDIGVSVQSLVIRRHLRRCKRCPVFRKKR